MAYIWRVWLFLWCAIHVINSEHDFWVKFEKKVHSGN